LHPAGDFIVSRFSSWVCFVVALLVFSSPLESRAAVPPLENLLPNTTKGFFLTPSLDGLRDNWNKTQPGQLMQDPAMKPFVDDLRRQLQEKWTKTHYKLGVTWDDFQDVPSGEAAMATVLLSPTETASAIVADVTGKQKQTAALLEKVHKSMADRKAKRRDRKLLGTVMIVFDVPKHAGQPPRQMAYFVKDDLLAMADSVKVVEGILARQAASKPDSLAKLRAFDAVMKRARKSAGDLVPNVRWFVEPFGYAEAMRLASDKPKKKGTDMLKVLREQGFDAVEGLGGFVNFSADQYDMLHRTVVYAPGHAGGGQRFKLAARMLDFPNGGTFAPPAWVPRDAASFATLNLKTKQAFEYSKTLVDALAADEVFEDVLDSLKTDENGPRVDIRRDVIGYLGNRMTIVSDIQQPITTKSERMLIAVNATDEKHLFVAVKKWMEADPDIRRREIHGYDVWEVVEPEDEETKTAAVDNSRTSAKASSSASKDKGKDKATDKAQPKGKDKAQGKGKDNKAADEGEEDKEERVLTPGSAVTVAHGHLFVATHIDMLAKVLSRVEEREMLSNSVDYRRVQEELGKLAQSEQFGQMFSRPDDAWRQTYELFRVGKLPEAESFTGKLLNAFLGESKDKVRQPRLDGSKLPDFEMVRRYLGPSGLTYTTEPDGWFLTGFMLNKDGQ
jgi:hypothetical protein